MEYFPQMQIAQQLFLVELMATPLIFFFPRHKNFFIKTED